LTSERKEAAAAAITNELVTGVRRLKIPNKAYDKI
jgi:hypothetical protein